jgi:hypothetical protein
MNTIAMPAAARSSNRAIGPVTFPNAIPVKPLNFDRSRIIKHSAKEIKEMADYFKEQRKSFSGTTNWVCWAGKDGFSLYKSQACHYRLPNMPKESYSKLLGLENGAKRKGNKKSVTTTLPFLTWFLYHSPYGEFILNRNNFNFCANYGFIVSGSLPQPILMNLAIISRHFYELSTDCFELFNKTTLEDGIDPTIAYSVIFNTYTLAIEGLNDKTSTQKYYGYTGHRVSEPYSPPVLLNIFNGVYGKASLLSMRTHKTIYGAADLFKTHKGGPHTLTDWTMKSQAFQKSLDLWRKTRKDNLLKVYRPPNPFIQQVYQKPQRLREGEFTNREAIEFVLPWLDAYIREQLNNDQ